MVKYDLLKTYRIPAISEVVFTTAWGVSLYDRPPLRSKRRGRAIDPGAPVFRVGCAATTAHEKLAPPCVTRLDQRLNPFMSVPSNPLGKMSFLPSGVHTDRS